MKIKISLILSIALFGSSFIYSMQEEKKNESKGYMQWMWESIPDLGVTSAISTGISSVYGSLPDTGVMEKLFGPSEAKMLDRINSGADINAQDSNGNTALMTAVYYNYPKVVQLLLDKDVKVNLQNKNGETALIWACKYKGLEGLAKLLIGAGADTNIKDKYYGWTALMWASYKNFSNIVEILLSIGKANTNIQDNEGRTALMIASFYGSKESIIILIKYRANIDATDLDGVTALMLSINKPEIVQLLINNKANLNIKDKNGFSALTYAVKIQNIVSIKLLLNSGAMRDEATLNLARVIKNNVFKKLNNYLEQLKKENKTLDKSNAIYEHYKKQLDEASQILVILGVSKEDERKTESEPLDAQGEVAQKFLLSIENKSPRDILGVSQTATEPEIKKAYFKLMLEWNPDKTKWANSNKKTKLILTQISQILVKAKEDLIGTVYKAQEN